LKFRRSVENNNCWLTKLQRNVPQNLQPETLQVNRIEFIISEAITIALWIKR
jgi:hypothetical protein